MNAETENRIADILRQQDWNALSEEDWTVVLKSILREDAEHDAAYRKETLDPLLATFPDLGVVSVLLRLDSRDGEIVAVVSVLKELKGRKDKSWTRMRKGFSLLIKELSALESPARDLALHQATNFAYITEALHQSDLRAVLETRPNEELTAAIGRIMDQLPA